jgi:alpha/beta hydrolase fold
MHARNEALARRLAAHRDDVVGRAERRHKGPPWPIVFYVHGGAFRILSKDTHWVMALSFARRGFVVFNVSYRLAPKHRFPAPLEDVCHCCLFDQVPSMHNRYPGGRLLFIHARHLPRCVPLPMKARRKLRLTAWALATVTLGCGGSVNGAPQGDAPSSDASTPDAIARDRDLTPPQDAVARMASRALGFFQRYREPPQGREMIFVALMPRGEAVCSSLSDLDVASSFRLEAEIPAEVGPHTQSPEAREAIIRLLGPGYENGVFVAPAIFGATEITADRIRGAFHVTVPDDPLEILACVEDHAPNGEVTQRCDCQSHAGVTSTCSTEGCCYAAVDGSFSIGMPFEATPCPSLCEGLKKLGFECLP